MEPWKPSGFYIRRDIYHIYIYHIICMISCSKKSAVVRSDFYYNIFALTWFISYTKSLLSAHRVWTTFPLSKPNDYNSRIWSKNESTSHNSVNSYKFRTSWPIFQINLMFTFKTTPSLQCLIGNIYMRYTMSFQIIKEWCFESKDWI